MEKYFLNNDVSAMYIEAESFPAGICGAFEKLGKLVPSKNGRNLYGISNPDEKGNIIYRAAIEEKYEGEAEELGCKNFIIKKGTYTSAYIHNFAKDIEEIERTFNRLLSNPFIDPAGYCVEIYDNDTDVRCLVRLDPGKVDDLELIAELDRTFNELVKLTSAIEDDEINRIPFEGSWTTGQVVMHLIKSITSLNKLINDKVEDTAKNIPDKTGEIKAVMLNFTNKFKSPDFIVPEKNKYEKKELSFKLESITDKFVQSVRSLDLTKTCTLFELPGVGNITRREASWFVNYHTRRHIHQLKRIFAVLKGNKLHN